MKILDIKSIECDLLEIDLNLETLTRRFPLSPIENDLDCAAGQVILDELESRYWLNEDEEVYREELRSLMIDYAIGANHEMA
jgi:hypothetical protein